jgi:hypothetical protein
MRTSIPATLATAVLSLLFTSGDLGAQCHPPPANCSNAPAWQEGAKYKAGDRVLGVRGNLWECKKGANKHLCDDRGYRPDVDAAASQAWQLIESCFVFDFPEVATTDIFVSSAQCNGSVTLSAIVANNSPFGGQTINVAFYHSASQTLIGTKQLDLVPSEGEPALMQVDLVWNNPLPGSPLITVVADDDGTGQGILFEHDESDNALATALATCPTP